MSRAGHSRGKQNRPEKLNYIKIYAGLLLAYVAIVSVFYYACGEQLHYRESRGAIEEFPADDIVGEITAGCVVEQYFINTVCFPQEVRVLLSNYDRGITGDLVLELCAADGKEVFASRMLQASEIGLNEYAALTLDDMERNLYGIRMKLVVTSVSGELGMSATALYSTTRRLPGSLEELKEQEDAGESGNAGGEESPEGAGTAAGTEEPGRAGNAGGTDSPEGTESPEGTGTAAGTEEPERAGNAGGTDSPEGAENAGGAESQESSGEAEDEMSGARRNGGLYLDGKQLPGSLCIAVSGKDEVWVGQHFWEIAAVFGLMLSAVYCVSAWRSSRGKRDLFFSTALALKRYGFLMEQLVSRDFKVRYKRSLLGILWSFFNPLLTMLVQFVVFSQLFKSDIDNIAVYMLSGLIIFNFFTEAVGQALGSIVYNAPLITKVYVPKYIYPVTKVLFSAINFLISMVVLLIVIVVTGEAITKAFMLLPFLIACVLVFSAGFGMLLASLMVFFRDIQFLWGIFSMLWMYMTPLFYPETLIAEQFRWIFTMNPMYYYVKFMRSVVLDGISPEPRMYLVCAAFALGSLLFGGVVFKKTQNKFILNI